MLFGATSVASDEDFKGDNAAVTGAAMKKRIYISLLNERGSMLLFVAAVLIPALLFAFIFSLDISKFFNYRERVQEIADNAVMAAAQALPYQSEAVSIVTNLISSKLGSGAQLAPPVVTSDTIQITLTVSTTLPFVSYFDPNLANISYQVRAEARITPVDAFMVIDSSSYMAPPPGVRWGSQWLWPSYDAFSNLIGIPQFYAGSPTAEVMTQRCYNPVISPIKKAAVTLFDYLSSQRSNAVGIGFYPSYFGSGTVDSARRVMTAGFYDEYSQQNVPEAILDPYVEYDLGVEFADANCAAIIDDITFQPYDIPDLPQILQSPSENCPYTPIPPTISLNQSTHYGLNPAYIPCVRGREAIWVRSARVGPYDAISNQFGRRVGDISAVLSRSWWEIMGAVPVSSRAGLLASARKVVIILAGDVPWEGGARYPYGNTVNAVANGIAQLANDNIQLYYLLFRSDGYGISFGPEVAQLSNQINSYPNGKFISDISANAASVIERVISHLGLVERRLVLSE
ncbi:MAG: hypothetical protein D6808_00585 [Candidatus Dadabacteria bacterium]|nr:MAG: hypothetical protein D6808_00585 [Candidatus Dadabacteria bacterium]